MKNDIFSGRESFDEGLKRIFAFNIRQASNFLLRKGNPNENIHQTRLCCKRLRSLLRLVRFSLGEEKYHSENSFYRDIAKSLSGVRDTSATFDAATGLISSRMNQLSSRWISDYIAELHSHRAKTLLDLSTQQMLLTQIEHFNSGLHRVDSWNFKNDPSEIIFEGFCRTYQAGRKGFLRAEAGQSDHELHEWRKDVKYLWYMLKPFTPVWPEMINAYITRLKTMSVCLGSHHDLILLESDIAQYEKLATKAPLGVRRRIALRKKKMRETALALGETFFAGTAKDFAFRMKRYWELWSKS